MKQKRHVQLAGLKTLWKHPDEVLNASLSAFTDNGEHKEQAIGLASEYLDFMEAVIGTDDPSEAWEEWCMIYDIEHEINNNPFK